MEDALNMKRNELSAVDYSPERLIDRLRMAVGARSYSALGRAIDVSPSVLSKLRHRRLGVSSEILLKIHDATGIPIRELRRWMGDKRRYFSPLDPSVLHCLDGSVPAADAASSVRRRCQAGVRSAVQSAVAG